MNFGQYAWRNGEFVDFKDCNVHITTHALHYGSSVFEGIRAYATAQGPAVFRLQPHTHRMFNSSKLLKMELPFSEEQINTAILDTIARNGHESCYVRPLAFRGGGAMGLEGRKVPVELVIFTLEWGRYLGSDAIDNGVDVQVSSWRRMAPGTAASWGKIGGQYVNSQFITMEAHDNGFHEGLALDYNGYVSEGAGENIFVVVGDTVVTPGSWASILLGVTRDTAITLLKDLGYEVRFEPIPRDMLYLADEIFLTGTAAEISPVRSVDRQVVGAGKPGPVTKKVQEAFFAVTSGKAPDTHGWLTHVRK
ncbi:MAG: branched-chain amino acid transaminase [Chloroflexi bacterium]|nr:branched-chain amino acid transaminase [Chloroflexota bacterium]